jgi:translocation and assembly module TamB
MLDKNLQPIQQQSAGIPINSNLTIHVGNNVRLSAFRPESASDRRFESGSG